MPANLSASLNRASFKQYSIHLRVKILLTMTDLQLGNFSESEFTGGNDSTLPSSQYGHLPADQVVHRKRKSVPIAIGDTLEKTKKRPNNRLIYTSIENISVETAPAILKNKAVGFLHETNKNLGPINMKINDSCVGLSVCSTLGPFVIFKYPMARISSEFCSLEDYFYKPKFKSTEAEWERAKFYTNFQEHLYSKNEFTPEELENELNERINKIAKHFKDFNLGALDEKSMEKKKMNKVDYGRPYLPTYKELEFLGKLFMDKGTDADEDTVFENLNKVKQNPHSMYNKGMFTEKENQIIAENWNKFQKEYKFYDMRPLINYRTCILKGSHDSFVVEKAYFISVRQQKQFLTYMRKGLNRSLLQVRCHIYSLVSNNFSQLIHRNREKRDQCLIDIFLKRYGMDLLSMEFILNSKTTTDLCEYLYKNYCFKLCPIADGPWTEVEMLRLIKGVVYTWNKMPTQNASSSLKNINWKKVFLFVRTRTPFACRKTYRLFVKEALHLHHYKLKHPDAEDLPKWTSKHELMLIKEMIRSPATTLAVMDFRSMMALPEFEGFSDSYLRRMARDAIAAWVPLPQRRNLDDSLDYLATHILPKLERKLDNHSRVLKQINLYRSAKLADAIPEYLDEHIKRMFATVPLHQLDITEPDVEDPDLEDPNLLDGLDDDDLKLKKEDCDLFGDDDLELQRDDCELYEDDDFELGERKHD
ncbi:uncharacterized protein LOC108671752 [Hyalella azteca]|uniref:Uncharacterized protein LOC108671752 n=1 Tax=Hyalella azteca TaxID=294128 RepID=A0A8B7NMB3_HYAAZ|nr:uncharacterized protein LOC108671752 [Hyalella azteca]